MKRENYINLNSFFVNKVNKVIKIMRIKLVLIIFMTLLLLPLFSAEESFMFTRGQDATLEIPIFENDVSKCTTCTCDITIDYPNGTNIDRSNPTTITGHYAIYNLYGSNHTSVLGVYKVDVHCDNGADNGVATFEYEVTETGSNLSTAEGIIYIIVFVVSLFLFGLSLIGAIKIKWSRLSDTRSGTLDFNDLRYVKLVLWFVSYLLLTWITFLSLGISKNFLFLNGASTLFNLIYTVLLIGIFPLFVVFFIVGLINIIQDKKYQRALQRGLPFR